MKNLFTPDRRIEKELLAELTAGNSFSQSSANKVLLAGVDEVGRGSLAGPVAVGVALIDEDTTAEFPVGLRDSKMLSPKARAALVAPCVQWLRAYAVGYAAAAEINICGIIGALQLAAGRAAAELASQGWNFQGVLLDGSHNWWGNSELFCPELQLPSEQKLLQVPVKTVVKGDAKCAVVAAASVLAKVARDELMSQLAIEYPEYDWEHNKGYSSPKHIAALKQLGATKYHRTAWHLPGLAETNSGN